MSDERLLSEALRAQAAGGVSTPRADTPAPPGGIPGTDGPPSSGRRRFRPLGRVRRPEQPAPAEQDRVRPDVPSPRSGAPGHPPPGYARTPMPPAPPTAPVRPGPTSGGFGAGGGPARTGPTARPAPRSTPLDAGAGTGYVAWSAVTVTWWSLVAILAGGVVGGAIGVLSLLLPA